MAPLKISYSGVRGVYGESLTEAVAWRFGAAFLALMRERGAAGPVLLGRDTRASGPALEAAVVAAIRPRDASGRPFPNEFDLVDLGVVGTPTAQFAMRPWNAGGAVVVTASHNPAQWNGFKFFLGPDNTVLDGEQTRRLFELYQEVGDPTDADLAPPAIPFAEVTPDGERAVALHIEEVLRHIDPAAVAARRYHVALDTGGGAGGRALQKLLEVLGCEVDRVYAARDSEPSPENLGALAEAVRRSECHVGMAQDLDGDRLALVSERGTAIGEDFTLALAVGNLLARHRGQRPVVVKNLSTTRIVDDLVAAAGAELIETPVGEINLSRALARATREGRVAFGGEGNGGVILPPVLLGRDSLSAAALLLDLMVQRERSLAELVAELPLYHMVKSKVPWRAGAEVGPWLDHLAARYPEAEVSRLDGLRLRFPDGGWVAVRLSNTEPVLRVAAESRSVQWARDMVAVIAAEALDFP